MLYRKIGLNNAILGIAVVRCKIGPDQNWSAWTIVAVSNSSTYNSQSDIAWSPDTVIFICTIITYL